MAHLTPHHKVLKVEESHNHHDGEGFEKTNSFPIQALVRNSKIKLRCILSSTCAHTQISPLFHITPKVYLSDTSTCIYQGF